MEAIKTDSKLSSLFTRIDNKLEFIVRKPILALAIVGITALVLRIYFIQNIPFTQDAIAYFQYSNDLIILKKLPSSFSYLEIGWPMFLSLFYSIFHFSDFMDYVFLQRFLSIVISIITIIPLYLFSKKIFQKNELAIVSTVLFVFEPHIVNNSLQGLSEPLFILLGVTSVWLFFSMNNKMQYLSIVSLSLMTIVRTQGIILFLVLSGLFFIINKKEKKIIIKYLFVLIIFSSILIPIIHMRNQTDGQDLLTGRISGVFSDITENNSRQQNFIDIVEKGTENLGKRIFQTMFPYFIIFLPFGIFVAFENKNRFTTYVLFLIGCSLLFSVYVLWASSDIRNIFWLYPFFAVLSTFTILKLETQIGYRNLFLLLISIGMIMLSWYFLYDNEIDLQHEKEAIKIAEYLAEHTEVINHFLPESGYLAIIPYENVREFPILHTELQQTKPRALQIFESNHYLYENLDEFIQSGREEGLSHIVVDDKKLNRPKFLQDVFYNENNYPYLIKEWDSSKNNFRYHVKIFKIDYQQFDLIVNKQ